MASTGDTRSNTETNIRWLKPDQVEAMRDAAHEGRHGHSSSTRAATSERREPSART